MVTAVISQDEAKSTLETFWRNVYLRGTMIYDPSGAVSRDAYGQPQVTLPASRWFVVGPDQTVVLAQYGYDPDLAIGAIRAELEALEGSGDFDGDDDVDAGDFDAFDLCFDGSGTVHAGCEEADLDGDADLDCEDWYEFILAWTAPAPLPGFSRCPAALRATMSPTDITWTGLADALAYDVMQGDLLALRATGGNFSAASDLCLQDDTASTSTAHGGAPPAGEVRWFLVRATTIDGPATYDSLAPSQEDRRDAGVAASGAGCP